MKLNSSKKGHYESGPNMTPLVDVVMVILIFLMLAGSFGAASHFLPWTMSGRGGRGGPAPLPTRLDLYVTSASDDTFQVSLSGGEIYSNVDSLRAALNAKRVAHEASGLPADRLQIMINPRLSTRYNHLAVVYEAAMDARWTKIGFHPARE